MEPLDSGTGAGYWSDGEQPKPETSEHREVRMWWRSWPGFFVSSLEYALAFGFILAVFLIAAVLTGGIKLPSI
jgi:hypothetical protein